MSTDLTHRTHGPAAAASSFFAKKVGTATGSPAHARPAGEIKHGRAIQYLRAFGLGVFFVACGFAINMTQLIGVPLYLVNKDYYYAYMAMTKQSFGLFITTTTEYWGPTVIRISGDASVAGQMARTADGRVEFSFPERLVMMANHQIYTDWIYLWWVGYANRPRMDGHVFIILKESLKHIPVVGWGMRFFGFIFMSRKMATDRPRLAHRLATLRGREKPMWLLLFPEGTNLAQNGRDRSAQWAAKLGESDLRHALLPRSTGMFFILRELKGSVDYVYDCTVAYEGVPRGAFGEQYFTLRGTYFQGRPPRSVNFYWRRFRVADIPLDSDDDAAARFDAWMRDRWREKDDLLEEYLTTGRFPAMPTQEDKGKGGGYVETEVRTRYWFEALQIFAVVGTLALLVVAGLAARWSTLAVGDSQFKSL